ncbi:MAG: UDP binding domain-containing protein, partial [Promethearchaeota archaeon]
TRNTPTKRIVNFLKKRYHSHNIEYIAHDPWVREKNYKETELTSDLEVAVNNSDVLLFVTNHKQYYSIDFDDLKKTMKEKPIIVDGRNIFDKKTIENKGFIYRKIGEGSKNNKI